MPLYEYNCGTHGRFEKLRPMSEAGAAASCPVCQAAAERVHGVPALALLSTEARAVLDQSFKSSDTPDVVSSLPAQGRKATPITRNPRHYNLPRP